MKTKLIFIAGVLLGTGVAASVEVAIFLGAIPSRDLRYEINHIPMNKFYLAIDGYGCDEIFSYYGNPKIKHGLHFKYSKDGESEWLVYDRGCLMGWIDGNGSLRVAEAKLGTSER